MKLVTIFVAMIFALSASAYAQGRGNGQAKKTTVSSPKPKAPAKPVKTAGKAETRVAKTETRVAKTTAKAETRAAKAETKAARKSGTIPATTTTVVTPTTPTTRSVKNPKLEARLLTLLPAGTNIQDASQGFKNWGQFVAAVHVSNNLSIPFADLKTAMTGIAARHDSAGDDTRCRLGKRFNRSRARRRQSREPCLRRNPNGSEKSGRRRQS